MTSILERAEVRDALKRITRADIVVGIPSYNSARTIGHVVKSMLSGLAAYYPHLKTVLVNSDGGSIDGTAAVVSRNLVADIPTLMLHHRIDPVHKIATPSLGIPGRGSAFQAFFEIAQALDAKACAVVDSDLRSITPEWVEHLIKPVLDHDFDFVAPLYDRHKYDGTITNSIIYPLTRALYGKRVRQPIGGDFGFSGRLAKFYLTKDVWQTDLARSGIDIWMTTEALAHKFKVAQTYLGAKVRDVKDPHADVSAILAHVLGTVFTLMEQHRPAWINVEGSEAVPTFGTPFTAGQEHVMVNADRMLAIFRQGIRNLREIWSQVLGGGEFGEVEKLGNLSSTAFRFPRRLWADIVYEYALAHHERKLPIGHLLRSLTPLYLAKTASFVLETKNMSQEETDQEVEAQGEAFEAGKEFLKQNWR